MLFPSNARQARLNHPVAAWHPPGVTAPPRCWGELGSRAADRKAGPFSYGSAPQLAAAPANTRRVWKSEPIGDRVTAAGWRNGGSARSLWLPREEVGKRTGAPQHLASHPTGDPRGAVEAWPVAQVAPPGARALVVPFVKSTGSPGCGPTSL